MLGLHYGLWEVQVVQNARLSITVGEYQKIT